MFRITNGGYLTRHPQSFYLSRPQGFEHNVFLCIHSEARIKIAGDTYNVHPGTYLLIRKNTPYAYSNPHGEYVDDWIHFECSKSDLKEFPEGIFNKPFSCSIPTIIETYIEQIIWENKFAPEEFRDENVHQLFKIIMRHCADDYEDKTNPEYSPYRFMFQKQRLSIQSAPYMEYKASIMADSIGISTSYYEHLYKEFFGISFRSDLINMRIDYAKSLISDTDMSFEQIAQQAGYKSEVHFYRQFQSKCGVTPGEFRRKRRK